MRRWLNPADESMEIRAQGRSSSDGKSKVEDESEAQPLMSFQIARGIFLNETWNFIRNGMILLKVQSETYTIGVEQKKKN